MDFVGNLSLFAAGKSLQIDQELTKLLPLLGWHSLFDSQCINERYLGVIFVDSQNLRTETRITMAGFTLFSVEF